MPASHSYFKSLVLAATLLISAFGLAGCALVSSTSTPQGWGTAAGSYGSAEWMKLHPGEYPTSESIAMYCVSIAEDGQKKYDWTIANQMKSSDSCVSSFVKGLSK